VKWFNASKGFGFIQRDFGGDVIAHYNFIKTNGVNTLNKGPQARNVSLILRLLHDADFGD